MRNDEILYCVCVRGTLQFYEWTVKKKEGKVWTWDEQSMKMLKWNENTLSYKFQENNFEPMDETKYSSLGDEDGLIRGRWKLTNSNVLDNSQSND